MTGSKSWSIRWDYIMNNYKMVNAVTIFVCFSMAIFLLLTGTNSQMLSFIIAIWIITAMRGKK